MGTTSRLGWPTEDALSESLGMSLHRATDTSRTGGLHPTAIPTGLLQSSCRLSAWSRLDAVLRCWCIQILVVLTASPCSHAVDKISVVSYVRFVYLFYLIKVTSIYLAGFSATISGLVLDRSHVFISMCFSFRNITCE